MMLEVTAGSVIVFVIEEIEISVSVEAGSVKVKT